MGLGLNIKSSCTHVATGDRHNRRDPNIPPRVEGCVNHGRAGQREASLNEWGGVVGEHEHLEWRNPAACKCWVTTTKNKPIISSEGKIITARLSSARSIVPGAAPTMAEEMVGWAMLCRQAMMSKPLSGESTRSAAPHAPPLPTTKPASALHNSTQTADMMSHTKRTSK